VQAWAPVGARYEFNEFGLLEAGGAPPAQRLDDKPATWAEGGLASLIPESIVQGLIGHPHTCPDMVRGGALGHTSAENLDQELFVRYAQLAALNPMMQFSLAPQPRLDQHHLAAVREAVALRQDLADHSAVTGEPLLRPPAYHDPADPGTTDEFTLGRDILVAPVFERGRDQRRVVFPAGTWTAPDGTDYIGPVTAELTVDLHTIPWFRRNN
jgi:alpha-glucosidase (family GH31 glycosyl hydrolase)